MANSTAPQKLRSFGIKLRYEGKDADENQLELYDGATSMYGFAQAIQISTHALINEEAVSRATALRGAKFYIKPPSRGSFLVQFVALIEQYPAATALSAPIFYDFLKFTLSKASGILDVLPETREVQTRFERDEPFFDELSEKLEGALYRAHRPIGESVNTVVIGRPRSELVVFDADSKDWVTTRDLSEQPEMFRANVTRYNSMTGNGRAYVQELKRIVPFRLSDAFNPNQVSFLTWSLHGSANNLPKNLILRAKRIETSSGKTKRLILTGCEGEEE